MCNGSNSLRQLGEPESEISWEVVSKAAAKVEEMGTNGPYLSFPHAEFAYSNAL